MRQRLPLNRLPCTVHRAPPTPQILLGLLWGAVYTVFNFIWPRFAAVAPAHKKWYVIANVSKCLMLALAVTGPFTGFAPSFQVHYDFLLRNQWHSTALTDKGAITKRWALWYVAHTCNKGSNSMCACVTCTRSLILFIIE